MPSTSVLSESETTVEIENPKVAVSAGPLGTVLGFQFVALFQLSDAGIKSHSALPAKTGVIKKATENRRCAMLILHDMNFTCLLLFRLNARPKVLRRQPRWLQDNERGGKRKVPGSRFGLVSTVNESHLSSLTKRERLYLRCRL